jgi:hypothetical protein
LTGLCGIFGDLDNVNVTIVPSSSARLVPRA